MPQIIDPFHSFDSVGFQSRQANDDDELDNRHIVTALDNLQKVLNVDNPNWSDHIVTPRKGDHISVNQYVDIFVVFDEAHMLSDSIDLKGQS